jgi:hypothetical protein
MKLAYIASPTCDDSTGIEKRCAAPVRAINRTGRHAAQLLDLQEFTSNSLSARRLCAQSDVIVIYRDIWGKDMLAAIERWRARDKIVIADVDAAYDLLPIEHEYYPLWMEGKIKGLSECISPPPVVQFKWALQLVNGAVVPSNLLVDDWRAYTSVEVVPDYVDLEKYTTVKTREHSGVIMGWKGGAAQFSTFENSGALGAVVNVCSAREDARLLICTRQKELVEKIGIPSKQIILIPDCSDETWQNALSAVDIGLAPLLSDFDHRSGTGPLLEYMVLKIPWAASRGFAYHDLHPYGWLVENSSETWTRVLLDMVDHIDDYKSEAGQAAYLFGLSQSIDENINLIIDTYARIASNAPGHLSNYRLAEADHTPKKSSVRGTHL